MEQQQRNSRGCLLAMAEAEVAAQPAAARAAEQEAEDESSPDDELSLRENLIQCEGRPFRENRVAIL